jgi:2-polyprenyl-3-methyl-5-hydroxy-6-metoxy-1,4-benzoquinol methylase
MDRRLREAWTKLIGIDDYEAHMALTGQAQANAELVAELFDSCPPTHGAAILFAGAGTGQLFEYVSPLLLRPFRTTFSDINPEYLRLLASRISNFQEISFETALDDVENSQLAPGFELVIAVLVLEHVDWRKAIRTICHPQPIECFW